jgi:hypothetical protein
MARELQPSLVLERVDLVAEERGHMHGSPLTEVTGAHMLRALDDLLDSSQRVTRALPGVPADHDYDTDYDDETDDDSADEMDDE